MPERYIQIRRATENICRLLMPDDYGVQVCAEVSPPKWHLAHTTWFFENFVLRRLRGNFRPFHPEFHFLFNSYYKGEGPAFDRNRRGILSRPTIEEVYRYRRAIDDRMAEFLSGSVDDELKFRVTVGLHHEQQHQELLVTDMKLNFAHNPLRPVYDEESETGTTGSNNASHSSGFKWLEFEDGVAEIGAAEPGNDGENFSFDNERPRHRQFVKSFRIASRPATNAEYAAFISDGGYENAGLWLADGWDWIQNNNVKAPLYWENAGGTWTAYTPRGMQSIKPDETLSHVSFFEADAFARWSGARLPTEFEWEKASPELEGRGEVWEWTSSGYSPYPGFKKFPSELGEYNGKFMCNQMVLRGGSRATPAGHGRPTYRNFFYPHARWQISGVRLAHD